MGFEMAASRLLAPWYGSSIEVWGTLITTLMTGLAIGTFLGGMLSRKNRGMRLYGAIISFSGVLIFVSSYSCNSVLKLINALGLEYRASLVLSSNFLFLLPCIFLGISTPYLVSVVSKNSESSGMATGLISSSSTFGCIAGTLITSFYLILWMGTHHCMNLFSALLFALGLFCMLCKDNAEKI